MAASIIDGKGIALRVREGLAPRVEALKSRGITPGLAVVLVGEDPASAIYVRNKERACKKLGMNGTVLRLPEETTQQELLSTVQRLNEDPAVHGILVQLPLPRHLDERTPGISTLSMIFAPSPTLHPVNSTECFTSPSTTQP